MKIALLFGIFPPQQYSEILNNSKGVVQFAADALQKSIIEGLSYYYVNDISLINLPYIGSWPQRYKTKVIPTTEFVYETNCGLINSINVGFTNIMGYKMYSRYYSAYTILKKWCVQNVNEEKVIIVYAIHLPFLKACVKLKKKFKGHLKIVQIVPDLPQFMSSKKSLCLSVLHNINQYILPSLYPQIDGFVLLTKAMLDYLPSDKQYTVVEGIYNEQDEIESCVSVKKSIHDFILYTGTLDSRYGVLELVKAFNKISSSFDIALYICGAGDALVEIQNYAKFNKKIVYKGQLARKEVLLLQKQALLLINPRTPEGAYVKYSFPSKTIEYFVSGTPTLLYKLPGIPDEYYHYCFTVSNLGVDALADELLYILNLDRDYLRKKGQQARRFILENKTASKQSLKIFELINKI